MREYGIVTRSLCWYIEMLQLEASDMIGVGLHRQVFVRKSAAMMPNAGNIASMEIATIDIKVAVNAGVTLI